MEPDQMDKWMRKVVQQHESTTTLDDKHSNRLWRKLNLPASKSRVWIWKAASLLLLCGVAFLLLQLSHLDKQNRQLMASYELLEQKQFQPEAKPVEKPSTEIPSIEQTSATPIASEPIIQIEKYRDTIVQYVPKEVIVYRDNEVVDKSNQQVDSLLQIVAEQQRQLAEMNDLPMALPMVYHAVNNIEVAFDQTPEIASEQVAQSQGMKFQLSFLKKK